MKEAIKSTCFLLPMISLLQRAELEHMANNTLPFNCSHHTVFRPPARVMSWNDPPKLKLEGKLSLISFFFFF